jgi:endonuclease YncB( thermonuclease family)
MAGFAFEWSPKGKNLAAYKLTRITDGDTPFIEMGIRMLSIDTPEVHYPGTAKPSKHDALLENLGKRLSEGEFPNIPTKLRKHLVARLDSKAGTRQLIQGEKATAAFEAMLKKRMKKGKKGKRKLFARSSDEIFDSHGRLLAYVAPSYEKKEREKMTLYQRRTFNLQLVEAGWAAPFMIYPSIPGKLDIALFCAVAKKARTGKKGFYKDSKSLTGYEFRMCVKMAKGEAAGPERYCASIRSGKVYKPEDYLEVKPEERMFIWRKDIKRAITKLGLVPQWTD